MKKILALPAELYQNRKLVLSLAKNDSNKICRILSWYCLGIYPAYRNDPGLLVCISVGLKAGTVSDYPFVLYLVSGIVPWFSSRMH